MHYSDKDLIQLQPFDNVPKLEDNHFYVNRRLNWKCWTLHFHVRLCKTRHSQAKGTRATCV